MANSGVNFEYPKALLLQWKNFKPTDTTASDDDLKQAADVPAKQLLDYFCQGLLSDEQIQLIEHYAKISNEFREDLILAGTIVVGYR